MLRKIYSLTLLNFRRARRYEILRNRKPHIIYIQTSKAFTGWMFISSVSPACFKTRFFETLTSGYLKKIL